MSLGLPAVAAWRASRLGYDLKTILGGFGVVGAYLGVVGWIIWGKEGYGPIKQKARRVLIRVLSNLPAVTTLALSLVVLILFLVEVRSRYNLSELQSGILVRYPTSLLELNARVAQDTGGRTDKILVLGSQVEALASKPELFNSQKEWPLLRERFGRLADVIRDYALTLQRIARDRPES
jgi:hypothetical protein